MKSKTTLLLLCFPLLIQAQQTNQTGIGKSAIEREPAKQKTSGWYHPGGGGSSEFWEFNHEPTIKDEGSKQYPEGGDEWLTGREKETFHDYYLSGDSLLCAGYENERTQVKFSRPQVLFRFPIEYGKLSQETFQGRGKFNNELEITLNGSISSVVNGWGTLILPSGDTLRNVFRMHIVIRSFRRTAPLSRDFDINAPVNEKIDISKLGAKDFKDAEWIVENICRWYPAGSRYPVFETQETLVAHGNEPAVFQRSSFVYKTDEQSRYPSGPLFSEKIQTQEMPKTELPFTYQVYPNPVQDNLQVNISLPEKTTVTISLYDIQGRQLRQLPSREANGEYTETVNLNGLSQGSYMLRLQIGSHTVNENIVKQ